MIQLKLILFPDGDIAIYDKDKRVYHRSYNAGDNLFRNLYDAFYAWENWLDLNKPQ